MGNLAYLWSISNGTTANGDSAVPVEPGTGWNTCDNLAINCRNIKSNVLFLLPQRFENAHLNTPLTSPFPFRLWSSTPFSIARYFSSALLMQLIFARSLF